MISEVAYDRASKPAFVTKAQHVFRYLPDGSEFEPLVTGAGTTPRTLRSLLAAKRCVPARNARIQACPAPMACSAQFTGASLPRTWLCSGTLLDGPMLLPVLMHWGPSAPAGLCRYQSRTFARPFLDNLFVAHFNFHKVTRHVLMPDGATFKSIDEDFLGSTHVDFHPTDVLEDADGSLLVIETGGWYRFCCPSSALFKPEVLGAIDRVRRTGAAPVQDPRGKKGCRETSARRSRQHHAYQIRG